MNAEAETTSTELTLVERAQVALQSQENERKLKELAQASKSITTITNKAGYDQCHSSRMALKKMRVDIEKVGKTAREDAQAFSKAVIAEQGRLIGLIQPEETRLEALQKVWDDEREREKQAKAEAERKRIASIRERIDEVRSRPADAAGQSSKEIELYITALVALEVGPDFAEFQQEAAGAKETALVRLRSAHGKALAHEEEQRKLAEDRERLRIEREEQEKVQAAERARIAEEERKAREAHEAEEQRIREQQRVHEMRMQEIQGLQQQAIIATCGRLGVRKGGTRECIVDTLKETQEWPITEENFGPVLFGAVKKIKTDVIWQIEQQLRQWDERAEQERIAAAARKAEEDRLAAERQRQKEEADRLEIQKQEAARREAETLAALEAEEKRLADERARLDAERARQAEERETPAVTQQNVEGADIREDSVRQASDTPFDALSCIPGIDWALAAIKEKRLRQIAIHGYQPSHDDDHIEGEIARAAIPYIQAAYQREMGLSDDELEVSWPWEGSPNLKQPPLELLLNAAALLVADIERLDRADGG